MRNPVLAIIIGVAIVASLVIILALFDRGLILSPGQGAAFGGTVVGINLCFVALAILSHRPPEKRD